MLKRSAQHIRLNRKIVPNEISGIPIVGDNAAHSRRRKIDLGWLVFGEELADRTCIREVQLFMSPGQ
jgi:hypothetical protein